MSYFVSTYAVTTYHGITLPHCVGVFHPRYWCIYVPCGVTTGELPKVVLLTPDNLGGAPPMIRLSPGRGPKGVPDPSKRVEYPLPTKKVLCVLKRACQGVKVRDLTQVSDWPTLGLA